MVGKIFIASGGTGGHVYPAVVTADSLNHHFPGLRICFAGGGLKKNPYFNHAMYPHFDICCASKPIRGFFSICRGYFQSLKLLMREKPDLILAFGSYHTFPILCAAKTLRIPIILHEANSIPGRVNRFLSPYVDLVTASFPNALSTLKGGTLVKMPLRWDSKKKNHEKARAYFGLEPNHMTFLLFGGSQGAQALNSLAVEMFASPSFYLNEPYQLLHFAGHHADISELKMKYQQNNIHAVVKPFEKRMDLAWEASDFLISRAGAGTIAEMVEYEVPAILIPYPHAMDGHQEENAKFVVDVIGGGICLKENGLSPHDLASHIMRILQEKEQWRVMLKNIRLYKQKMPKFELSDIVVNWIRGGK